MGAYCQVRALERSTGEKNNQGFGVYFSYTKLNVVIFDLDVVILGLDLIIFGSNSVCHAIKTVETGWGVWSSR